MDRPSSALAALVASASSTRPGPGISLGDNLRTYTAPQARVLMRVADGELPFTATGSWQTFEGAEVVASLLCDPAVGGTLAAGHTSGPWRVHAYEGEGWAAVFEAHSGYWELTVAAAEQATAERICAAVGDLAPKEPLAEGDLEMTVWTESLMGGGRSRWSRCSVGSWAEVAHNYPAETRASLERLAAGVPDRSRGGMVVFTGPAGTGKTRAVEALMAAWAPHADLAVVADVDRMLGSAAYLTDVLTAAGDRRQIVVAEDADDLMVEGLKSASVSKLLNVADGLIGRLAGGAGTLLVLTANLEPEEVASYVQRPGRTAAAINFPRFSAEEANGWLEARGHEARVDADASLAELYAMTAG